MVVPFAFKPLRGLLVHNSSTENAPSSSWEQRCRTRKYLSLLVSVCNQSRSCNTCDIQQQCHRCFPRFPWFQVHLFQLESEVLAVVTHQLHVDYTRRKLKKKLYICLLHHAFPTIERLVCVLLYIEDGADGGRTIASGSGSGRRGQ